MGIRLVIQGEGDRETIRAAAPTLIIPVHAAVVDLDIGGDERLVDRASWVLLPAGRRASMRAKSPTAQTLVLSISDALRTSVVHAYDGEIRLTYFERYVGSVQPMKRTVWVNELAHRYLFERAVCKKRDNAATTFLEMELVKELYFNCHDRIGRTSVVQGKTSVTEKALAAIEAHLFETDVVLRATKACGASESSLLRAFKKELGQPPLGYVRARRLDESLLLVKSGRYSIGEIAVKVGYQSFAAFSQAFRARFGMKPSEISSATVLDGRSRRRAQAE